VTEKHRALAPVHLVGTLPLDQSIWYQVNVFFGLWWADPLAALIMVPIIAKEGIEGVQGKACDDCCGGIAEG
jgi:hypothetical protein